MSVTPRLGLPLLSVGQAQKELFHNEALQLVDILLAATVEESPRNDPPAAPALGACYIVGIAPTGPWAGKAQCVAAFTGGGWRFVTPFEGLRAFVPSDGVWMLHRAGVWESGIVRGSSIVLEGQQVVGSRQAAVPSPAGGTVVDSQARTAISEILGAMRAHGLIEI
jgi:hypothetical protein